MVKAARPRHPPKKTPSSHLSPTSHNSSTTNNSASDSVPSQQNISTPLPASATVDIRNIVKREVEEGERKGECARTKGHSEKTQIKLPLIKELDITDTREGGVSDDLILDDSDVPPLI